MKKTFTTSLSEKDIAAIKATSKTFAEAANSKNWAEVAATYTEDAVFMPSNSPTIEGRTNIQAFFEAFPPMKDMSLEIVEIEGLDDMAYVRGTYTMTIFPEGENAINDSGKFLEIRQKQVDGSWLLYRDIFNSDA